MKFDFHNIIRILYLTPCADPEKLSEGSNFGKFDNVFFFVFFHVDKEREDPKTTMIGPPSARQRNAIKMAFCWRADDGPTLNAGLIAL